MLSPRIRRLKLDYDTLIQRFANWPVIQVSGTAGMPPEVYRITFQIKGLYVSPTGEIQERDTHQLEINLSLGYPRRAPQCRMMAPSSTQISTKAAFASATSGRPRKASMI